MSDLLSQLHAALAVQVPTVTPFHEIWPVEYLTRRTNEWCEWKTIAEKWLPGAVTLSLVTESEYNDEGGYYNYLTQITGRDIHGNLLTIGNEQWENFQDAKCDWELPRDVWDFDFRVAPSASATRSMTLATIDQLRQWVNSLPDACFEPES